MGGIVTQSRAKVFPALDTVYNTGQPTDTHYGPYPPNLPSQVTTSWRTRGSKDPPEDITVGEPKTEAGVFKFLIDDAASRDTNPYRPYDTGHEFSSRNYFLDHVDRIDAKGFNQFNQGTHYVGPVIPAPLAGYQGLFPQPQSGSSLATKYGNIAVKATAPTNPASSSGQALGELALDGGLADVPGHSIREKAAFFRSLGNEYLNVQFGWVPFVSDVRSIARALINRHKILTQYQKDSGKPVRRTFRFAPSHSVDLGPISQGQLLSPLFGTVWNNTDGRALTVTIPQTTYQLTTTVTQHAWFKGCFTYYLPDGSDFLSKMERSVSQAQKLLGSELTPETLWQLTPWSWLVDWFTHIGRMFTDWSRFSTDGLVLKYGYVMFTTEVKYSHALHLYGVGTRPGWGPWLDTTCVTRVVTKERFRSTPYGFGIDTSHLSDFQWSILAALGLTKSPKVLH